MKTRPLVLGALLAAAIGVAAPAADLPTGLFEVKTGAPESAADLGLEKLAVIKAQDGFALATKLDTKKWKVLGRLAGPGSVRLPADAGKGAGALLTITDAKGDGAFAGKWELNGKEVQFTASLTTVGGLYRCGNHAPKAHLADGLPQMRELSKQYGCEKWKAESSLAGALAVVEKLENIQ